MCRTKVIGFIVTILIAFAKADDTTKNDTQVNEMSMCFRNSTNIKNTRIKIKTCVTDYINGNTTVNTCNNGKDVNKTFDDLLNSFYECVKYNDKYMQVLNESTRIRKDIFTVALKKEKLNELMVNNGTRCTQEMYSDMLKCVNDSLEIQEDFKRNISYSLIQITKVLLFDRKPCNYLVEIKACIQNIPRNDCNVTKKYVTDIQDYMLKTFCKLNDKKVMPNNYSSTGVTVGVLFAVIIIAAILYVVYKKRRSICRKGDTEKEEYACSYNVAKDEVKTN
ncbi:uncharacterized protein LOC131847030 [Achroia grisella]|uniref:uncharacterized protein LOC131847030 n=1 Tax=Achroia grisella TaxID=688607 RepID=UPI0027D269A7|nr:uncharacterized protein LOC131847030 [Achroia grisella]